MHVECYTPKGLNDLNFNVRMPADQYAKVKNLPYTIPAEMLARSAPLDKLLWTVVLFM